MTHDETLNLSHALEESLALLRAKSSRLSPAREAISSSLEALRTMLQPSSSAGPSDEARAGVLVVARDMVANALETVGPIGNDLQARSLLLALATLHNGLVAAVEAMSAAVAKR